MSQPSLYMSATVRPGFTRIYFGAEYFSDHQNTSSEKHPIVLCIDQPCANDTVANAVEVGETTANDADRSAQQSNRVCHDDATNTFRSAIALAEQDPLLQCVASWFHHDFDWRPLDIHQNKDLKEADKQVELITDKESQPVAVDMTLSSQHSANHQIGLSFAQPLSKLPSFPANLCELVAVQEHRKSVKLCIASMNLSDADAQRLQPGSCVLLPDTFKETCPISLCDEKLQPLPVKAVLDRQQNMLLGQSKESEDALVSGAGQTDASTHYQTSVFLEKSVTVDFSKTQNANQSEENVALFSMPLESLVGQRVLVQRKENANLVSFEARLVAVGAGLAALLESA